MKILVENKLKEIYKAIANCSNSEDSSLFAGSMGVSLFLANYSKYTRDKNVCDLFEKELIKPLNAICEGIYKPSFSKGLSGILYSVILLNENKFSDLDISHIHQGYAPYLKKQMLLEMETGRFDFMHGAIGIAIYLLKNGNFYDFKDVIKLVDKLDKMAIRENKSVKWETVNPNSALKAFNISLSHGMSSIAIFLCKIIKMNIDVDRCSNLLIETINYITQQEIDHKKFGSYFPSYSIESEKDNLIKSRLGWCYGDLGVARALWISGCTLGNKEWKDKAIKVLEYSTTRRNLKRESVNDAGICHGTSGISHIFKRIYIETKNPLFLDTHNFWIEQTIKMASFEDGLAGYKTWKGHNLGWSSEISFIEGIAGIGLALLSSISDAPQYSNWDEILLIS